MFNIIFKSGEIEEVDDKEANLILKAFTLGKQKIILNGKLRDFYNVLDIKPVKKDIFPKLPEAKPVVVSKQKYLKHLNDLRNGFLKHFNGKEIPAKSSAILRRMDRAIIKAKELPDDYRFNEVRATSFYV
jgi:hypothetical protein